MDRKGAKGLSGGDRDLAKLMPAATIWEDAVDLGYVARETVAGLGLVVTVTEDGEKLLREHGRAS
jgi:hypothetical protein